MVEYVETDAVKTLRRFLGVGSVTTRKSKILQESRWAAELLIIISHDPILDDGSLGRHRRRDVWIP